MRVLLSLARMRSKEQGDCFHAGSTNEQQNEPKRHATKEQADMRVLLSLARMRSKEQGDCFHAGSTNEQQNERYPT